MRYFLIVALALILTGCGKSGNSVTNPEEPAEEGGVAFTFKSSKSKIAADLPEPTNVRVLVRRYENNNLSFNALADVEVPTDTTVIISVPANDDYQIDAFSYIDSTVYLKPILKVDQAFSISVSPNEVTQVSLTLEPASAIFSVPDTVEKGTSFTALADYNNFFEVPESNGKVEFGAYLNSDTLYTNSFRLARNNTGYYDSYPKGGNAIPEADIVWDNVNFSELGNRYVYFQLTTALFASEFYQDDEYQRTFVLNYPNPYLNDTLKTFVKIPEGSIGVDVTY